LIGFPTAREYFIYPKGRQMSIHGHLSLVFIPGEILFFIQIARLHLFLALSNIETFLTLNILFSHRDLYHRSYCGRQVVAKKEPG
jgi:hypothetical protein